MSKNNKKIFKNKSNNKNIKIKLIKEKYLIFINIIVNLNLILKLIIKIIYNINLNKIIKIHQVQLKLNFTIIHFNIFQFLLKFYI